MNGEKKFLRDTEKNTIMNLFGNEGRLGNSVLWGVLGFLLFPLIFLTVCIFNRNNPNFLLAAAIAFLMVVALEIPIFMGWLFYFFKHTYQCRKVPGDQADQKDALSIEIKKLSHETAVIKKDLKGYKWKRKT